MHGQVRRAGPDCTCRAAACDTIAGVRRHSPAILPARFTIPALAFIIPLLTWLPAAAAPGQIIDRVVAVVAGDPITLSDVAAAARLGLVTPSEAGDQAQVLELLVERRLQLIEVNRYLPPEPSPAAIDKGIAATRARFSSDADYAAALREVGVSQEQLRTMVRDSLRLASYLQQRFGANYQPTDDDIARYYKANAAEFASNGATPPLAEVRDAVRARILEQRMTALVRDWIDGLRRRGEVTILPR
jgi:parvulin-like peptidyl-prolyl isomerase